MVTVVAHDFFHRHIDVLTDSRGVGSIVFVHDGKLVAVAEVHELLSIARQVQINASVHVVVIGFG